MNKLKIGYFYKKQFNLYGDNGNVEILVYRALARKINVNVEEINIDTKLTSTHINDINLIFMGGGSDSSQKSVYTDLISEKGKYLEDYIQAGGVGLFVCGSYQLLGKYYKASDGSLLEGLSIFNMYTLHFGNNKKRCVGNVNALLSDSLLKDPLFDNNNHVGNTIVGFENHGGRTFLDHSEKPLARVTKGFGNNAEDKTEGILHKNAIGTYLHGPILARNPHLADYLIGKSLNIDTLEKLDDSLEISAHTASKKLK